MIESFDSPPEVILSEGSSKVVRHLEFQVETCMNQTERKNKFRYYWKNIYSWFIGLMKFAGPGWLVSIGLIDAGNYEGDIQAGASFQYKLIWVI
jgi:hypothetical protein